jgi:hypothetical protein
MEIYKIKFSEREAAILYALAGQALKDQGKSRKEAREICDGLTPQNLVRLALGFETRNRGGTRPNAGRPKAEKPE